MALFPRSAATSRDSATTPAKRRLDAVQRARSWSLTAVLNGALFVAPLACALALGYRQRWVAEDAFITLRVVDNLLAGHGPVFNIGERVEVYTHPLWMLMLAGAGQLGIEPATAAVYLGLALSVAGLAFAQLGAARLARHILEVHDGRSSFAVPVGALVFVALPVVWDFLTSGLETGLTFAWLGASFWLLVRRATAEMGSQSGRLPLGEAAIFGFGPLVRPDLGLFALAFLAVLIACKVIGEAGRRKALDAVLLLLAFGSFVGVYQVFRMGYFAALVPNTALAKEAAGANWGRGWAYFSDLTVTYHLWIPLVFALTGWAWLLWRARRDLRLLAAAAAPVVAAMLHALYVIRVGGDFMHGRLLLPALFGVLLPVAAVVIPRTELRRQPVRLAWAAVAAVAVWALACGVFLRWSPGEDIARDGAPQGIVDERAFFVAQTGSGHPMSVEDYQGTSFEWVEHGWRMRDFAATYPRIVLTDHGSHPLDEDVDPAIGLVIYARSIGVQSHAAGDQIRLVDLHGLGDPLASRMKVTGDTERPGHEKTLPLVWIHARYADLDRVDPLPWDLQAAAAALQCGDVAELLAAVEEPMTPARFLENIGLSGKLTALRIDPDPQQALRDLCGAEPPAQAVP